MRAPIIKSVIITSGIQATTHKNLNEKAYEEDQDLVLGGLIWFMVVHADITSVSCHHFLTLRKSEFVEAGTPSCPSGVIFKSVYSVVKRRHSIAFSPIPINLKTGNQVFCTPSST